MTDGVVPDKPHSVFGRTIHSTAAWLRALAVRTRAAASLAFQRVRAWQAARYDGLLAGTLIFAASFPLICAIREFFVLITAVLLRSITHAPLIHRSLGSLPFDPIYSLAALETVGRIRIGGLAVGGQLGNLLHAALPGLFAPPARAAGHWTIALILPGSAVLGRDLSLFAGNFVLVLSGLALTIVSLKSRRVHAALRQPRRLPRLAVFGLLLQGSVIANLIANPPLLSDLEVMGVSFAFGVLFPALTGRSMAISDLQYSMPAWMINAILVALGLLVLYLAAVSMLIVSNRLRKVFTIRHRPPLYPQTLGRLVNRLPHSAPLGIAAVCAVTIFAVLPLHLQGISNTEDNVLEAQSIGLLQADSDRLGTIESAQQLSNASSPPSAVIVRGQNYGYSYLANGELRYIRGMGYNPMYSKLGQAERGALYDRDFSLMRRARVNTVFGWTTAEFDDLLLDKAYQHGLGVAMPFDLAPSLDYSRPEVQAALNAEVLAWVEKYKYHPALHVWAIGNEVLHKIVFPSWLPLKKNTDEALGRANAFARFYAGLIDQVHKADPAHPVLLRDAEDGYVPWIRDALAAKSERRSWFMYGVNVYTNRLNDIVANWPKHKLDAALLISEFAPAGMGPRDRPEGYRKMWEMIRRRSDWTVGAVPYVWLTVGPEEVDRAFGLVDGSGKPVDGSLDAIAGMFGGPQ